MMLVVPCSRLLGHAMIMRTHTHAAACAGGCRQLTVVDLSLAVCMDWLTTGYKVRSDCACS